MDISSLKTFLEVYKTRHFGKAANNLFVTQSAVSARIRQLEEKLGVRLFTRDRNNIQPTEAGQKFFSHAESILKAWNRAQLNIALDDDKRDHVVIAGIPSLWDIFLGNWIIRVNKQFPDIVLTCETLSHDVLSRRLIEGIVDIGFAYEPPQHEEIVSIKQIPLNLIMVSSHKGLKADEAVVNDYIYIDWGTSFAAAHANYFSDIKVPSLRISLVHLAIRIIKERGGTAYLPEAIVKKELRNGRLYKVANAPTINREAQVLRKNSGDRHDLVEEILKKCQFNSPSRR